MNCVFFWELDGFIIVRVHSMSHVESEFSIHVVAAGRFGHVVHGPKKVEDFRRTVSDRACNVLLVELLVGWLVGIKWCVVFGSNVRRPER